MTDEYQIDIPPSFFAVYTDARQRLSEPIAVVRARYEICEDLASHLVGHAQLQHHTEVPVEAEILRRIERHGVTYMCAAPAVVASALDAAKTWEGEIPGRDRVRIIVAGAPPPTRTIERVRDELGWSSSRSTASPRRRRC